MSRVLAPVADRVGGFRTEHSVGLIALEPACARRADQRPDQQDRNDYETACKRSSHLFILP